MSNRLAERVFILESPGISRIKQKAQKLESGGIRLTYLLRGEPDFDTPTNIRRAAHDALEAGHTHYPPNRGIPQLRQAIASRMSRDFSFDVDPEKEILVTTGATMGIFLAVQSLINPGDEVIIFDPIYDPYPSVIKLAGGVPIKVRAVTESGRFVVPGDAIRKMVSKKTKALLVNNPWNPTGTVLNKSELDLLIQLAIENNLFIIMDEIYEKLVYDGRRHLCLAALSDEARNFTITINSFSKTYAMTGWRLGYVIAAPHIVDAMLKVAQQFSRSATSFVQMAGVEALNGPQESVKKMVEAFQSRRDILSEGLKDVDAGSPNSPEGTIFYFMNVKPYGLDSLTISERLLNEARVVTVPGDVYGEMGRGYIRLSFAYKDRQLREGVESITRFLQRL